MEVDSELIVGLKISSVFNTNFRKIGDFCPIRNVDYHFVWFLCQSYPIVPLNIFLSMFIGHTRRSIE